METVTVIVIAGVVGLAFWFFGGNFWVGFVIGTFLGIAMVFWLRRKRK